MTIEKRHDRPFAAEWNDFAGETDCSRAIAATPRRGSQRPSRPASAPRCWGMCLRAVLLACALALVAATPAAASKHVLTTIGQGGPTTCTVTVEKIGDWPFQAGWYDFSGETSCDRAIDQSGQARLDAGEYGGWVYAPACSGFRTTCTSSSTYQTDDDGLAYYRFTLVAPHGQAWLWRGSECQGSGSDRITCEYTGDNLIWWST